MSKRMLCVVVCATLLVMMPARSPAQKPADLPVDLKVKCLNAAGEGLRIGVPPLGSMPIDLDFGFPVAPAADREQLFQFWVSLFKDEPPVADEGAGCLTLDVFGPALWSALAEQVECTECPAPVQRILSIPMLSPALPVVNIGVDLRIAPRVQKPTRSMTFEIRARFNNNKPQGDAACDPHWLAQAKHLYLIGEQCRKSGDLDMARNCYQEVQLLAPQSSYARKAAAHLEDLTCDDPQRARVNALWQAQYEKAAQEIREDEEKLRGKMLNFSRFGPRPYIAESEEQETQSPGDWWQERFLKAAREIREERLRQRSHIVETPRPEYEVPPAEAAEQAKLQVERAEHARQLYHQGEFYRRTGAARTALYYYKAAHAMCPTCAFGERARKHIFAIEESLRPRDTDTGEESEVPPAKPDPAKKDTRSRILESTVPLEIYLEEVRAPVQRLEGGTGDQRLSEMARQTKRRQICMIVEWLSQVTDPSFRRTSVVEQRQAYVALIGAPPPWWPSHLARPRAESNRRLPPKIAAESLCADDLNMQNRAASEPPYSGNGGGIQSDSGFFGSIVSQERPTILVRGFDLHNSLVDTDQPTDTGEPWNSGNPLFPGRAVAKSVIDYYPPTAPCDETKPVTALSTRLADAVRRLLDSLDLDVATDGEAGLRIGVNLGGQRYQFHYSSEAWMVLMSPATAANR